MGDACLHHQQKWKPPGCSAQYQENFAFIQAGAPGPEKLADGVLAPEPEAPGAVAHFKGFQVIGKPCKGCPGPVAGTAGHIDPVEWRGRLDYKARGVGKADEKRTAGKTVLFHDPSNNGHVARGIPDEDPARRVAARA